jgi:alkanesulfonate monooxygenase SsuD/methylene tetrahydromethanopterin reductase-like flavin-dependent oxidoreductase (luciferase family)
MTKRLGLFTRLLADTPAALPAQVYRNATEQFVEAERLGFDVGWVAQHHFDAEEGGLPSPLVFLAGVAAHTARIRLATGIITAALEDPVRVAEDAAVLDAVSGGRVELGLGSGGSTDAFTAFGKDATARAELYGESVARLLAALAGEPLGGTGRRLQPDGSRLLDDIWQATFSPQGGTRAGLAGSGLLLSRTQPRTEDAPHATLAQIQQPIVAAHAAALRSSGLPRHLCLICWSESHDRAHSSARLFRPSKSRISTTRPRTAISPRAARDCSARFTAGREAPIIPARSD